MEETKKLAIPEGYEFDCVKNGEVILKKKAVTLSKTLEECKDAYVDGLTPLNCRGFIPASSEKAVLSLVKLLICRDAWWKQLGWKPDWRAMDEKYCIHIASGEIETEICYGVNHILAFPTEEVCAHFYVAFKDLIEEAKELL